MPDGEPGLLRVLPAGRSRQGAAAAREGLLAVLLSAHASRVASPRGRRGIHYTGPGKKEGDAILKASAEETSTQWEGHCEGESARGRAGGLKPLGDRKGDHVAEERTKVVDPLVEGSFPRKPAAYVGR